MKLKKIISFALSFIIAFSAFAVIPVVSNPIDVKAEVVTEETDLLEPEKWYKVDTWIGDDGIYWGIVDNTLIIKGNGAIPGFSQPQPYSSNLAPWWNCSITKVIIREGITGIGENAFNADSYIEYHVLRICSCDCHYSGYEYCENCSYEDCYDYWEDVYESKMNITEVVLPNSLKSIAQGAFCYCDSIEYMTLPFIGGEPTEDEWDWNDYTMLGYIFTPTYQNGSDFDDGLGGSYNDPYVSNDYVPDTLKKVILTEACEVIAYNALSGCNSIENITLPDKPINIATGAFDGTKWYDNQTNGLVYLNKVLYGYKGTCPENVVVKEGTLSITSSCFYGTKLKSITIPDSVKIAGACTFYDCTNLTNVYLGNGIDNIGRSIFYNCTSLESIEIPDSITVIESSAFDNCSALLNITFGNNIVEIRGSAFSNCTSLKSITLPAKLKSIGTGAFSGCISLEKIDIPDTTETIGSNAFQDCTALADISIPESVYYVGSNAFKNTAAYNNQTEDLIYISNVLLGYRDTCPETITIKEGTMVIASNTFYNCDGITSIDIPNTVKGIGDYTFYGCTGITSVTIPDSVTNIGSSAFVNCSSLTGVYITDIEAWCEIDFKNYSSNPTYYAKKLYLNGNLVTKLDIPYGTQKIDDGAFYNCADIISVIIPDSIESIGNQAFYNCSGILNLTIPDSVKSIGSSAFWGCSSLQSITLPFIGSGDEKATHLGYIFGAAKYSDISYYPSGVESIRYVPTTLKTITISDKCENIGDYAFYGCQYISTVNIGKSVKNIGAYAFYQNSSLTSATIPNSVENIGNEAFYNCRKLATITLGENIESIGKDAFYYCSALKSIYAPNLSGWLNINFLNERANPTYNNGTLYIENKVLSGEIVIPQNFTRIGSYAFYNNTKITGVTFHNDVKSVGINAFGGCTNISKVNAKSISSWSSIEFENINANPTCYGTLYINSSTVSKNLTIPSGVERIGSYTFVGQSQITDITISDTVESIGIGAFEGCSAVQNIKLPFIGSGDEKATYLGYIFGATDYYNDDYVPTTLTNVVISDKCDRIGEYAFSYCSNITSIKIGENVKEIGRSAFSNCDSLISINIPKSITNIADDTFYDCQSLTSITIPEGVTSIGYRSFSNCSGLKNIVIPNSVTSIGSYALEYCNALESITLPLTSGATDKKTYLGYLFGAYNYSYNANYVPASLKKVTISDGAESLGEYAFYNCTGIEEIVLPKSLKSIGNFAFYNCTGITKFTMPENVTYIGESAFYGCPFITEPVLPDAIEGLGANAFHNTPWYQSLSDGLIYIDDILYGYKNTYPTTITVKTGTTVIAGGAFKGCTSLTNVNLNDELEKIGENVFYNCSKVKTLYIPETVTSIGSSAFYACGISTLTLPEGLTEIDSYAFEKSYLTSIAIPANIKTINKGLFSQCSYLKNVIISDGVTSIGDNAFYYCKALTEINLPDSITSIGISAFSDCTALKNITIPKGVTEIKGGTFDDCDNLTEVTITGNIKSIGSSTFKGCDKLKKIVILEGVESIGDWAFAYCDALTHITIPTSVTKINDYAFYSCDYISTVYYTGTSEQWYKISIGTNNDYLYNATKYYNRCNCSGQLTWYDYTAPTCTEEGNVEYYLCSLCEKYFTSDKNELDSVIIEATGHSYKSVYTPPTCIQQGNTTYTCETCQYSYVDNKICSHF